MKKKSFFKGICAFAIAGMLTASLIPTHTSDNINTMSGVSKNLYEKLTASNLNDKCLNTSLYCGLAQAIKNITTNETASDYGTDSNLSDSNTVSTGNDVNNDINDSETVDSINSDNNQANGNQSDTDSNCNINWNYNDNSVSTQPDSNDNNTTQETTQQTTEENSDTAESGNNNNDSSTSDVSALAVEVANSVNSERSNAGLSSLEIDVQLFSAAQIRSNEIVSSFSHTRPNGSSFSSVLTEQGISYRGSGENIAWGQRSASEVMNAWMNSEGHKANILNNDFTKIGVGVYQSSNGTLYWTQLFTY